MGVNFSPFEIGRRALQASQLGLTVAGQNIANVSTPGYSRQSVMLSASAATGSNKGLVGSGVTIEGVRQFRDQFVETRLQNETATAGRLSAQREALAPIDEVFNETDGNGVNAAISNFFNAFQALEANPNSFPLRADIISKANSMTSAFAGTASRLTSIRTDVDRQVRSEVEHLNDLTRQVAELNVRISTVEHSNKSASELRDQRGDRVRQIAESTGARAIEDQNGMVTLTLGDGQSLVSGDRATTVDIQNAPPSGLAGITLNGQTAVIADGKLKGLTDAIDFINTQMGALNDLAASITARVNALHVSGTDRNGNPGGIFFDVPVSGVTTAANFSVAASIKGDPNLIVSSVAAPPGQFPTVAGAIGSLLTDPTSTAGTRAGSFSSIYASIVADAGKMVQSADGALTTQNAILAQTTAQRDAVSGVSLDEEAISLLQFQRSYEAAARFLQVADEMTRTIMAIGQ